MKFADNIDTMNREQLISYINDLEARLGDVSPKVSDTEIIMQAYKLTAQEARVLLALQRGRAVPTEHLRAVCADSFHCENNEGNLVRVLVSKLRKKLAPHGFAIENVYGIGYKLETGAADIAAMLELGRFE